MALLGTLPLGHRPDAKTAALIGFGSGMSTSVILTSPTIERADTIEIDFPLAYIAIEGDNLNGDIFRELAGVVEEAGSK